MIRQPSDSLVSLRRIADIAAGFCAGLTAALACVAVAGAPQAATTPAVPAESPAKSSTGSSTESSAKTSGAGSGAALPATALSIIDGDTFEARVAAFPGQEIVARVRVDGVDTPERRGRCASEIRAAEAAAKALSGLVEGHALTLTEVRGDKYFGRVVARVSSSGVGDVAAALVAAGHGRAYGGGKRAGWCG